MNKLPEENVLKFNPDTLEAVRKLYKFDKIEELNHAIDIFDSWVQKQTHFTEKSYDRDYLERMIIASKGSVERAKENLDKICTIRNMMPHFFQDFNVRDLQHFEKMYFVLLPKLTKGQDRVFLGHPFSRNYTSKIYFDAYKMCIMIAEYTRVHDYFDGSHIILDYRLVNAAEMVAALDLVELHQIMVITTKCYSIRIKGIHIVTPSKTIDKIIFIAKQLLSEKLKNRVYAHPDLESLYKIVPKEIMPSEFGGEEKPIGEINADWVEALSSEEFRKHWRRMCKARTDESVRQSKNFNEEYLGMPGSFRTLSVD